MLLPIVRKVIEKACENPHWKGRERLGAYPYEWAPDMLFFAPAVLYPHPCGEPVRLYVCNFIMSYGNPPAGQAVYFGRCDFCGVNVLAAAYRHEDDFDIWKKEFAEKKRKELS